MARLLGYEPKDLLQQEFPAADSFFLLNVDIVVTGLHVAVPVRWVMLWPFELISCFVYIYCSATFGNSQDQLVLDIVADK